MRPSEPHNTELTKAWRQRPWSRPTLIEYSSQLPSLLCLFQAAVASHAYCSGTESVHRILRNLCIRIPQYPTTLTVAFPAEGLAGLSAASLDDTKSGCGAEVSIWL